MLKMNGSLHLLGVLLLFGAATAVTIPDGHLLVFKNVYDTNKISSNFLSLYKVGFDGSVSPCWNHSSNFSVLYTATEFGIDTQGQLFYVVFEPYLWALSLTTGELVGKYQLHQNGPPGFYSYDYVAKEKALYGMCSPAKDIYFCRILLETLTVELLSKLPGTHGISIESNIHFTDKLSQSIWYQTFIPHPNGVNDHNIRGVNYTTGEEFFFANSSKEMDCVKYDPTVNRTFTLEYIPSENYKLSILVNELFPWPKKQKTLVQLSPGLRLAFFSTCAYDIKTHTFIALMTNKYNDMPTQLLLVNVMDLTHELIPTPEFMKWNDEFPITSVYFVPKEDQV